jgi:hypothetical protein
MRSAGGFAAAIDPTEFWIEYGDIPVGAYIECPFLDVEEFGRVNG